jgi:hypothetical protein
MKPQSIAPAAFTLAAFLLLIAFPRPAWAYVDPGTGSYLFQAAMAVLLSSLFVIKHYFKRIRALFNRTRGKDAESESRRD